jgi:hypothetical protein
MAQHDYDIANQSFPAFRTDLNNVLGSINSSNSGTSRPSSAVAGTIWLDTSGAATAQLLKFYDGAADITLATVNFTANTVEFAGAGGVTFKEGGTNFTNSLLVGTSTTGTLSSADKNTGVGCQVLAALTTGDDNTAIGRASLNGNTTGSSNVAVGSSALNVNTTGGNNTALGTFALDANTTASNNVGLGFCSLTGNTTGADNTAVGAFAMRVNSTGASNTAFGRDALVANTTGSGNTAMGLYALDANTTGSDNIAIGQSSMTTNTTGHSNTSVGRLSLLDNTTGNYNLALGREALPNNTTGTSNVSVGYYSLFAATTAGCNVAVGVQAGDSVTTGFDNTLIGDHAGHKVTTGSNNTLLGVDAGTDAVATTQTNSNQIVIGNNNNTHFYAKIALTVTSDLRDKMNIEDVPYGLDFVNQITPIKYNFKKDRETEIVHGDKKYGFKAQEILALEGDNPVIINNQDTNNLKLTTEHLIPVLVNAIKELTARVKDLENN